MQFMIGNLKILLSKNCLIMAPVAQNKHLVIHVSSKWFGKIVKKINYFVNPVRETQSHICKQNVVGR